MKHFFTSVFILSLLLSSLVFAGAWVQKKDGAYIKFSASYLRSDQEFNHLGNRLMLLEERLIYRDVSFEEAAFSVYAEYGMWNRTTLLASLPIKVLTSRRTEILAAGLSARVLTLYSYGIGDITVGARHLLLSGLLPISLQANVKIPSGYDPEPENEEAPLGSGKIDVDGHLLAGGGFISGKLYWSGGLGYRWRGGKLNNQILMQAEAGYSVNQFVRIRLGLEILRSTVDPPDIYGQTISIPISGGGGALPEILVGDQDIDKLSPAIIVAVSEKAAVQLEAYHIFAGKNTLSGTTVALGLVFER